MPPKLHFHSDCEFFAGCERGMPLLWNSDKLIKSYDLSFSFSQNARYQTEVKPFLSPSLKIYPVRFQDDLLRQLQVRQKNSKSWLTLVTLNLIRVLQLLTLYPRFIYDVLKLLRLFRKIRPEILHLNNGGYPGALSVRAAAVAGWLSRCNKIVMVVNNIAAPYERPSRWLDYPLDRLVVRSTNLFVTASLTARESLIGVLHLDPTKVVAIPNSVSLVLPCVSEETTRCEFGSNRKSIVVGMVALLTARKGHFVLVQAIKQLLENRHELENDLSVWFVGDGEMHDELQELVSKARIGSIVKFLGYRNDYSRILLSMDIVVQPSLANEDSPLATIEAMGLGKPIVASRLAGLAEQIAHGENGFLIDPGSTDQLANALEILIDDVGLRQRMGDKGKARYQALFSMDAFIERYYQLYSN